MITKGNKIIPLAPGKYWVTHRANGINVLTMSVPRSLIDPNGGLWYNDKKTRNANRISFACEDIVKCNGYQYRVKNIEQYGEEEYTIDCEADISVFRQIYYPSFKQTMTLRALVSLLSGGTWITSSNPSELRNESRIISMADSEPLKNVTGLDILKHACEIWDVRMAFQAYDDGTGAVVFYDLDTTRQNPNGEIYAEGPNLEVTGHSQSSVDAVTRLYAYGKRDETTGEYLTFASINNGKEYVDAINARNVICAGWIDERYTVKTNLLAAAKKKVEEMSQTDDEYEMEWKGTERGGGYVYPRLFYPFAVKLKAKDEIIYPLVVEWTEYPDNPALNSAKLSSKVPDLN